MAGAFDPIPRGSVLGRLLLYGDRWGGWSPWNTKLLGFQGGGMEDEYRC